MRLISVSTAIEKIATTPVIMPERPPLWFHLEDVESRGHTFTKVGRKGEVKYGYAAAAVVNTAKGTVNGGAEPRRSHGTAAAGK